MEDIEKILIKLHYKARKEAVKKLLKKEKNPEIIKKLKEIQEKLPANY